MRITDKHFIMRPGWRLGLVVFDGYNAHPSKKVYC